MKKAFHNTKVSVKLRKAEAREEWYLYIESYPVIVPGKDKPLRVRERRHNGVIDLHGFRESHYAVNIRRLDVHAGRVRRNAAVARQGVDRLHGRILLQLLDDGVLAAAAANNKDIHNLLDLPFIRSGYPIHNSQFIIHNLISLCLSLISSNRI